MKNLFLIVFILFASNMITKAQDSKKESKDLEKEEQYTSLVNLINSEQYIFKASKANPQKGTQIDLTTRDNFLIINKENASADMPYFGRAYSGGYSTSDGGVKFDGPMETYEVSTNDKKRRLTIKFKIKGPDDTYTCTFTVSGINNASLSVISNKRQTISYIGSISELPKENPEEN